MSKFEIVFSTDNQAFEEDWDGEIKYQLQQVLRQVESGSDFGRLRDTNGNRVGFFVHQEG